MDQDVIVKNAKKVSDIIVKTLAIDQEARIAMYARFLAFFFLHIHFIKHYVLLALLNKNRVSTYR